MTETRKLIKPRRLHLESVLDFGKYKGTVVRDLIKSNPKYFVWMKDTLDNVSFMPDLSSVIDSYLKTGIIHLPTSSFEGDELLSAFVHADEHKKVVVVKREEAAHWGEW